MSDSRLPSMRRRCISDDDIDRLSWLTYDTVFRIFYRFAHSDTAISFALEKAKSLQSDLIAAKTTNPRTLPSSCTHLQKLLDKYLRNSSEAEASLQFYFIIALELEKVKARIAKLTYDLDTIFPNCLTQITNFLKSLDPDINSTFDPVDLESIKKIFKKIRLEIRSIFLNRQLVHQTQAERRQQQRAAIAQQQSEVLTFTRRDFESEVRRLVNAASRRPKNGHGRRNTRANRDVATPTAPPNRSGRQTRNNRPGPHTTQPSNNPRATSITRRVTESATGRRQASADARRSSRPNGPARNQRRAYSQVRGNGNRAGRRNTTS